jgi:hypothetical protein
MARTLSRSLMNSQYNQAVNGTNVVRCAIAVLVGAAGGAGCGAAAHDAPLTLAPGEPRAQTIAALRDREYCRPPGPERDVEIYPACDAPGAEYGQSWVAVEYRADRMVRLQRFEHYDDDERAIERWNDLVRRHVELDGAASQDAREAMVLLRGLPDGTRSWFAFYRGTGAGEILVGVYLMTPARAGDANVLEEIIAADRAPEPLDQR